MAKSLANRLLCSVEDCGRLELSNGLCSAHYQRQRQHKRLHLLVLPLPQECEVDGCFLRPRNRFGGRAMCNKHGLRWRAYGQTDLPPRASRAKLRPRCAVGGCGSPSRSSGSEHCELHYYRMRRNGTTDGRQASEPRLCEQGYMARFTRTHPLSPKSGVLYQHREVLYDAIGDAVHACYWCGTEVEWKAKGKRKLVVDHLDGDKAHNRLSNLKPSCHRCNSTRGTFQNWVMLHRDDPFLWSLYEAARRAA